MTEGIAIATGCAIVAVIDIIDIWVYIIDMIDVMIDSIISLSSFLIKLYHYCLLFIIVLRC